MFQRTRRRAIDAFANRDDLEAVLSGGDTYKIYLKGKRQVPENMVAKIQGDENAKMFCGIKKLFEFIKLLSLSSPDDPNVPVIKEEALAYLEEISTSNVYVNNNKKKNNIVVVEDPEGDDMDLDYVEEDPTI